MFNDNLLFSNLALDDAGFSPGFNEDYQYLSALADKSAGKHLGRCYIEGDDRQTYFVNYDDAINFAEGDRVSFEFIPKGKGEKCWARNIKKIK